MGHKAYNNKRRKTIQPELTMKRDPCLAPKPAQNIKRSFFLYVVQQVFIMRSVPEIVNKALMP